METEQETSTDRCLTADLHVLSMTLNNTALANGAMKETKIKPHFMIEPLQKYTTNNSNVDEKRLQNIASVQNNKI